MYRVSHSEVWQVIWVWQIEICKLEFFEARWFWNPEFWIFQFQQPVFQKSIIGWPQQPPTEKVLKFNMIFHNSTRKHKNKAEFKILGDSEVLSSDFPGLKTSAVSMASTVSKVVIEGMACQLPSR